MSDKVIIDHSADNLADAYSINTDLYTKNISNVIDKFLSSEDGKVSELGDFIQNEMSYNEILYLAQLTILNKLDEMENDIEIMEKLSKQFGL